jgi:hypothetical protein
MEREVKIVELKSKNNWKSADSYFFFSQQQQQQQQQSDFISNQTHSRFIRISAHLFPSLHIKEPSPRN